MLRSLLGSQIRKTQPDLIFTIGRKFGVRSFHTGSATKAGVNVFDRRAKLLQRERAAAMPDVDNYDFMKEEVGYRHKA